MGWLWTSACGLHRAEWQVPREGGGQGVQGGSDPRSCQVLHRLWPGWAGVEARWRLSVSPGVGTETAGTGGPGKLGDIFLIRPWVQPRACSRNRGWMGGKAARPAGPLGPTRAQSPPAARPQQRGGAPWCPRPGRGGGRSVPASGHWDADVISRVLTQWCPVKTPRTPPCAEGQPVVRGLREAWTQTLVGPGGGDRNRAGRESSLRPPPPRSGSLPLPGGPPPALAGVLVQPGCWLARTARTSPFPLPPQLLACEEPAVRGSPARPPGGDTQWCLRLWGLPRGRVHE